MDKLSERLWVMRVSLENLTDDELATFDEAIALAKRYEDAPVVTPFRSVEDKALIIKELPEDYIGESVRILREEAGGEA